ncbi:MULTISPECIES: NADH-quinone oxidoreductase subunit NuoH [Nitrosomonas]|uniref:NADH-quinone oxidoreductase subunit H n=1 Tax=Nitrosomonas communis TaxID=44574 RepID=A0A0F7KJK1_9PROT|nr:MULTISPECIES: NADH-quinone oxidoreductase subunit NuoH [Nitrosomonas]AKH39129.1 NADH:ubiquinone oxidoreductase [Nitrosomonas communis]TYP91270.1 NADH-quinone oxidoreductase subunit H [Nitrosomonas communis]UVS61304.1 NADH-quinone oxidoreductase subunit NuoH [Nitrosomonas sp. PLL12]
MSFTLWLLTFASMVLVLLGLLLIGAILSYGERRILALLQDRLGPNRAGPFGLLQPVADILKLISKEDFIPPFADRIVYTVAPIIVPMTVLISFAVVPVSEDEWLADLNIALLYVLALSSLRVYGVMLGGWASNSKYSLLGGLRSAAQMISYELPMGLALVGVVMLSGSFSLREIVAAQELPFIVLQPLGFIIFLVCGIAETNRLPFDLPEAENELAAGYNTEYGGIRFAFFYLGEYLGVLLIAALVTVLFLGGWHGPWLPGVVWFALKTLTLILLFFWLRTSLPRLRYDQLMDLGWKLMLPAALLNLLVTAVLGLFWMRG